MMVTQLETSTRDKAKQDIDGLFKLAKETSVENPYISKRYVALAKTLSLRNRINIRKYNRVHCSKCDTYFTSKTLRVRTRDNAVVYTCLCCGYMRRMPK